MITCVSEGPDCVLLESFCFMTDAGDLLALVYGKQYAQGHCPKLYPVRG